MKKRNLIPLILRSIHLCVLTLGGGGADSCNNPERICTKVVHMKNHLKHYIPDTRENSGEAYSEMGLIRGFTVATYIVHFYHFCI